MKQPQYQPMDVEKQVLVIWAATNGYTDDIASKTSDVRNRPAAIC